MTPSPTPEEVEVVARMLALEVMTQGGDVDYLGMFAKRQEATEIIRALDAHRAANRPSDEELIEAMAKAIYEDYMGDLAPIPRARTTLSWDHATELQRFNWRKTARAALAAMRDMGAV